jgi:hypothetical protein
LRFCTRKNHALADMAQLFVSRYHLELPRREELVALLEAGT